MLKHFIYSSSSKSTTSSLCLIYYRYSLKLSSFFCILSFLVRAISIDQTFYSATHYLAAVWLDSRHDLNTAAASRSQSAAAASRSQQTSFFMITLSSRSLNKRDFSLHIAYMIFSTLFSIEIIFFNSIHLHVVTSLVNYHNYLMRYKDDRFAHHSQFRYWTFNNQLQKQIC